MQKQAIPLKMPKEKLKTLFSLKGSYVSPHNFYVKIITKSVSLVNNGACAPMGQEFMVLIAENLHIISKTTKEAILNKDDEYIINIVKKAFQNGLRVFDLNIGPAKGPLVGSMEYLTNLLNKNFDVDFSFDTSNFAEMRTGVSLLSSKKAEKSFLNSVCADIEKMNTGFEIAGEFGANIIALAFNPAKGIAKTSDERLELSFNIFENAASFGILENKVYFDPLVLPLSVAQEQANVVLETIRMLKEGMGEVQTIVGLSNISNGSPKEIRPLLNRVFLVLAMGAGLDSAIVDGFDVETVRVYNMIRDEIAGNNAAELSSLDSLYFSLYNAVNRFDDIDEIKYDKSNKDEVNIVKAARVLLNKEIYSHSFFV